MPFVPEGRSVLSPIVFRIANLQGHEKQTDFKSNFSIVFFLVA